MQDETTPEDIKELEAALRSLPEVAELKFVSKQEALKEMQENFGEQGDILEGLEEKNPLPDTFRIKTQTVEQVVPLARELAAYPRVDQVRYGQGVVEKLLDLSRWVRTAGLVTMVLLAIAAVFPDCDHHSPFCFCPAQGDRDHEIPGSNQLVRALSFLAGRDVPGTGRSLALRWWPFITVTSL